MDIYITKYALTKGIQVGKGEIDDDPGPGRLKSATVEWPGAPNGRAMFFHQDYHVTLEAAQARVDEMIAAKRKSLEKTMKTLDCIKDRGVKVHRIG